MHQTEAKHTSAQPKRKTERKQKIMKRQINKYCHKKENDGRLGGTPPMIFFFLKQIPLKWQDSRTTDCGQLLEEEGKGVEKGRRRRREEGKKQKEGEGEEEEGKQQWKEEEEKERKKQKKGRRRRRGGREKGRRKRREGGEEAEEGKKRRTVGGEEAEGGRRREGEE